MLTELKHALTPKAVQSWVADLPAWVEVVTPKNVPIQAQLDPGENEAIALAIEVHADFVLIDEQAGRQEAVRRGLKVAGTLAVLDAAEKAGLADFDEAVSNLQKTSFRVSQTVLGEIKRKRSD